MTVNPQNPDLQATLMKGSDPADIVLLVQGIDQ